MATSYRLETYEPRLRAGQEYQDYVARQLLRDGISLVNYQSQRAQRDWGENALGMEIKFDAKLQDTGNLYIEIAEKSDPSRAQYVQSGIYREDNSWLYAIGNYRELFLFSKRTLKLAHMSGLHRTVDTPTSQGFLLARRDAVELSEKQFGPWFDDDWG